MAGAGGADFGAILRELLHETRRGGQAEADAGLPLPEPPVERNHEVDHIIQSIKDHKLDDFDKVLETTSTCPAGAAFAAGVNIAPFPRMSYVGVSGDASHLKEEVLTWMLRLAASYAHVRRSLEGQTPEVALGMAIAYYVLRRGCRGSEVAYDTQDENVKASALAWLKVPTNQELPMGLGKISYTAPAGGAQDDGTGGESETEGFSVDPQVSSNTFFLMSMLSTHGQNITTDRIAKFLKAANEPLARVTCNLTPDGIRSCWNGLDAGGAVNQRSFIHLAGIVYKYVKDMPTFAMGVPQSQLRGLTAFQMVARLHVEYATVDLREFWTIAGLAELEAVQEVFRLMKEKTAFMAMFESLTNASSERLRVSARLALAFLRAKNDVPRIDRYAGRWAKAPLTPEMAAWVERNKHVRKGGSQLVGYITVEQSAELAAAMANSLATVNFSGDQTQ